MRSVKLLGHLKCKSDISKIPNGPEKRFPTYTDGVIVVTPATTDDPPTKPHMSSGKNKHKANLLSECKLFWFIICVNICNTLAI